MVNTIFKRLSIPNTDKCAYYKTCTSTTLIVFVSHICIYETYTQLFNESPFNLIMRGFRKFCQRVWGAILTIFLVDVGRWDPNTTKAFK